MKISENFLQLKNDINEINDKFFTYKLHMMMFVLAVLTLQGMGFSAASAQTRVIDGDTIEVNNTVYRLHGIDAPEAGQKCNTATGGAWPCGKMAIEAIERLVIGKSVRCDNRGKDGFGRTIAVCMAGREDLNAKMVQTGMAWAFVKFSDDYAADERIARAAKTGVWQSPTQTPWEYRAAKWEVGKQVSPQGCPIKGNISRNGRIYHAPWSPWYSRTKINTAKGERWFCNEADAIKAGWRAPYWGR